MDLNDAVRQDLHRPSTTFLPDTAPPSYITHIIIERISGNGPWKEQS